MLVVSEPISALPALTTVNPYLTSLTPICVACHSLFLPKDLAKSLVIPFLTPICAASISYH